MLTRFKVVHLSGPSATCCLQSRSDERGSGPSCTFGGKQAKTATPVTCRRLNDGATVVISDYAHSSAKIPTRKSRTE
jgi:hypothetical protein